MTLVGAGEAAVFMTSKQSTMQARGGAGAGVSRTCTPQGQARVSVQQDTRLLPLTHPSSHPAITQTAIIHYPSY